MHTQTEKRYLYLQNLADMFDVMRTLPVKKKIPKRDKDKDGDQIETSFLQNGKNKNKDKPCYCCGIVGCIPSECPKKEGLARDQWFDKTGKVLE